jgi:hypothetical protein
MAELWDGLVMIALGVGTSVVGQRLRYQYLREFDALREMQDPVYAMNALLGIFGAFFAASGAWHLLRSQ